MLGPTRSRPRCSLVLVGAAAIAVLAACTAEPSEEVATSSPTVRLPEASPTTQLPAVADTLEPGAVDVEVAGLQVPWSIVFDGGAALVSERDSARVLELAADGSSREVGAVDGAVHRGEGGLLGLALHRGDLYAYLTTAADNRIVRLPLTGRPGSFGLGVAETVVEGLPAAGFHNGGRIAFGPDGMLYATVGDAGDRPSAQDLDSLGGKILRLTPDGDVPADNPFAGSPVYSYGHRNPQGLAWDEDGTLYASEFGQDTWDELNVIEAGGNDGWPEVEGVAGRDGFVDPVQQWPPDDASPSGMTVAEGSLFIANLRGQRLREVPLDDLGTSSERFVGEHGRLRDVALGPDGALWVLTNNTDGRGEPGPDDDRILRTGP